MFYVTSKGGKMVLDLCFAVSSLFSAYLFSGRNLG
ncbi:conserved hypothetical protein [Enterococcus faecium 1,141,733]|nr:conserved hypothetical protein [Enterococcus faecium 1,141,733]EEV58792.1 conserved hypothetical protein [Enterococcus faecium Com12]